jgi:hypothetical protein
VEAFVVLPRLRACERAVAGNGDDRVLPLRVRRHVGDVDGRFAAAALRVRRGHRIESETEAEAGGGEQPAHGAGVFKSEFTHESST